jgi:enterochelin esterase-like enzyme
MLTSFAEVGRRRLWPAALLLAALAPLAAPAQINDLTYASKLNRQEIAIKVYLPPGYERGTERYPVVYNLHGGGGSPARQWDRTRATLTAAMEGRLVRPMIYVFVNGLGNTEFVNTADGKLIERSIIEELIPFIDAKYRTVAAKRGRAIDGFSMGGFGALSVALRNPETFAAVVSYGAALTIKGTGRNYRGPEHFAEHDPWSLVRAKADAVRRGLRVRMVCGESDGLFASNVKFKELLDSLKIPVEFVPVAGVAHCTQCLYEEAGVESLKFIEESFARAARGVPADAPGARPKTLARKSGARAAAAGEPAPFRPSGPLPRLGVSENKRFLVTADGRPFFWLGDTAWLLFQKLDREEVDKYFEDRAAKQFSVVLAHVLPWQHGETNVYGEAAFVGKDFTKPNEKYWKQADYVIDQAAAKGLYLAMLPMWARNYVERKGEPSLIDARAAYVYGKFLGARYGGKSHVVWLLGGDALPKHHDVYDALAKGVTDGAGGDAGKVLMSYHPPGGTYRPPATSSGEFYHDRPWLDFNLIQSGHEVWRFNYEAIAADYARVPAKPTAEGEPNYEDHPVRHDKKNGVFNDWHVRLKAYWSVFAGGFGFTYGANGVWQMDKAGEPPFLATHANLTWDQALDLPGARQVKHLRRLIESRPFLTRVPDDGTVLSSPPGEKAARVQVTRGRDRTWAMYYVSDGHAVTPNLANLKGPQFKAWWFSPRDGRTYDSAGRPTDQPFASLSNAEKGIVLDPPGEPQEGNDWVLVLDNAATGYPPPGSPRQSRRANDKR